MGEGLNYRVLMTAAAHRRYRRLPEAVRHVIQEEARKIGRNPFACRHLSGFQPPLRSHRFRWQGTSYRIAYRVDEKARAVIIVHVGRRAGFYTQLRRLIR